VRRAIGPADLAWSRTLSHRRAVDRARSIIDEAMRKHGLLAVALSCGKDSTALLGVAAEVAPISIFYGRYRFERDMTPDRCRVERALRERFSRHEWISAEFASDFDVLRQRRDGESLRAANDRVHGEAQSRGIAALRAHKMAGELLGLRREESRTRLIHLGRRGPIYWTEVWGMWIACPLAGWSEEDVWAVIASRDLPYDGLYDRIGRSARNETSFLKVGDLPRLALAYPQWARILEAEFGASLTELCARASEEWGGE
jgi:3'-phosphoadenosine 5'-phosphosulfate sulfotransferase (PAPS reductase)/FAD synthetase